MFSGSHFFCFSKGQETQENFRTTARFAPGLAANVVVFGKLKVLVGIAVEDGHHCFNSLVSRSRKRRLRTMKSTKRTRSWPVTLKGPRSIWCHDVRECASQLVTVSNS